MIFVQGNHDVVSAEGLSREGEHDTLDYGVYVIHEVAYPSDGGNISVVNIVASNLETYLQEKVENNNNLPIFVISHLPLHYSTRTRDQGAGAHAELIFEVLNEYAGKGQNIIYLFGHNHSSSYDDYLGGSSVFLTKGDTIYIPELYNTSGVPKAQELQFTYINAGYVGYRNSDNFSADKSLTMTVFQIEGQTVKIERFNTQGLCNLKQKGVWDKYRHETAAMYGVEESYRDKIYESPQIIGE